MAEQQTVVREIQQNNAIILNSAETGENRQFNRNALGQFGPGNLANPGGRPRSRHVTEELKARLENGDAEVIGSQLIEMAKDKSDKWLALAATKEVVDRTEGKAMTRAIVGHTVDPNALARLNELADKLGL